MSDVGHRFLRSTAASYASMFFRLAVAFFARVAMARLVLPEGHGLYELALRVVMIAAAVRDLGLPFHLVRDPRRPYGTVLAFSLGQGALITVLLLVAAPWTAGIDPDLPAVLRLLAPWVLLDGLAVVPRTFFERELRIGRVVAPELARGVVTAALWIGLAWAGFGVWSFVWGELAGALLLALLVWRRAWGEIPLVLEPAIVGDLMRKSAWLFVVWVALQAVQSVDLFVIGWLADATTVGHYVRAYTIAFLVQKIVSSRALLPALVEYRHDGERFLHAFRMANVLQLCLVVVAGYFLFFNAERTVAVLLGPEWGPSVALLAVLCFVPFLDLFTDLGGEVLKVRHEDRLWLTTTLLNLASLLGFGIPLTVRWGAMGMAVANFLLVGNLVMAWRMRAVFGRDGFRLLMADLAWIYLVPLPGYLLVATLLPAGWGRFWASGLAAVVGLALLAARYRGPVAALLGGGGVAAAVERSSETTAGG